MVRLSSTRRVHLVLLVAGVGVAALVASRADRVPRASAHVRGHAPGAKPTKAHKPSRTPTATRTSATAQPAPRGDAHLRGELDLSRIRLRNGRYELPLPDGRRAILTLDPAAQIEAERVLTRAKAPMGAVVVMATDGRLLALAGRRKDAPNKRAHRLALSTWAPAASIFKIVTTAALMDAGIKASHRVCFHGGYRSVDKSHLADSRRDRQCESLAFGFAKSQNAIFAKLAHRHLGPGALRDTARNLGFDAKPNFALPAETSSCDIPEEPLPFARVSAGFWHTKLSCLGGAVLANTVAAGGLRVTPRIVERIIDKDGTVEQIIAPKATRALSSKIAAALGKVMVKTTEMGTARKGFKDRRGRRFLDVSVAGKTGTLSRRSGSYLQYSWFVGFAPADEPTVSISVLLGNPEKWHLKAHTAARMVLSKTLSSPRVRSE